MMNSWYSFPALLPPPPARSTTTPTSTTTSSASSLLLASTLPTNLSPVLGTTARETPRLTQLMSTPVFPSGIPTSTTTSASSQLLVSTLPTSLSPVLLGTTARETPRPPPAADSSTPAMSGSASTTSELRFPANKEKR